MEVARQSPQADTWVTFSMCANGVIVGDTVTPVLRSLLPGFSQSTVGAWIINRQVVIITSSLFVMYPLSLNRDIAKLSHASGMGAWACARVQGCELIHPC